jgi:cellulose 1,4-beta-cellobiosidase
MKQLIAISIILASVSLSPAQGIQGNVTLSGNSITVTGHSVSLTWVASQGATSYNVYRGAIHGGPYLQVASGIAGTAYTDIEVTSGQTFYYVTTAVNSTGESSPSNEAVATIP